MDSNDDSLFAESEDSHSDQETDASSESSSHQMPNNKILILSAESLSSFERETFELPSELDLRSYNIISKSGLNISAYNAGKRNPVVVKAQPILSSRRHILLPESSSFPTEEDQIRNVFYNSEKKRSIQKRERERNVTSIEKSTLFRICEKYPVLKDKTWNNEINNRKRKAWENIQVEFLATCPDPESKDRSIKFLQGCWSRFQKENRKARRAHNEGVEETTRGEFPNKHSTPLLSESEFQSSHDIGCLSKNHFENIVNVDRISDSLVNGEKTITSVSHQQPPTESHSNGDLPLNRTNSGDSMLLSIDDSLISGEKTATIDPSCRNRSVMNGISKANISGTNAESLSPTTLPTKLCLSSAFETKPMSIRSLRRKALELAVEVEKEKLAAFRYQKEVEQERLAAMKLQKSAQRYAAMAEKERYETELLKREAARLALKKEKLS